MKRVFRILVWAAGIVVVLLVLLVIGVKLFFPVEKAKALAVERGSKMLGRPLSVADVSVSLWGGLGIRLEGVTIASPMQMQTDHLLTADALDLKLRLLPLLTGTYRVDRLIIDGPHIYMFKNAEGDNNYTFTFPEPAESKIPTEQMTPETKAAATAVSFERFEINNGRLEYVDDSSKTSIALAGLNLSTTLKNPLPGQYESTGRIEADTVLIRIDEPMRPLAARLRYHAAYSTSEGRLSLHEAELRLQDLVLNLAGELVAVDTMITARADIQSREISVENLLSLLPPSQRELLQDYTVRGEFMLDADLDYDARRPDPLAYAGTAVLSDVTVSQQDVPGELTFTRAVVDFKPDNVRVNIEDGYFDGQPLKGHLVIDNFDDPTVSGALAGSCDLSYVIPFIPTERSHQVAGRGEFDVKIAGRVSKPEDLSFSGSVVIAEGRYQSDLLPLPVESFSCDLFFDNRVTRINRATVSTAAGTINLSGRVDDLVPYLLADSIAAASLHLPFDAAIDGTVELAPLSKLLPPEGNPTLSGSVSLTLAVAGDVADLESVRPRGKLNVENVAYTDQRLPESMNQFDASLRIAEDTLVIENMAVQFESSDLSLSGKLIRPLPYLLPLESIDRSSLKKPFLTFNLSSHRFDTDRLFPEAVAGSGTSRADLPPDSVPPIILPDIDGQGDVRFDTVVYSRVEFTNLTGKAKIRDRRITLDNVVGEVYSGDITGQTTIDLNNFDDPGYTGEVKATRIEADEFLTRFTGLGGHLFGKADLNGTYSARGWEPEEFQRTLTFDGDLDVREGVVKTDGVLHELLSNLATTAGRTFEREQPLKALQTPIKVNDGRLAVDRLKTKLGNVGDVELTGFYALDLSSLDYRGSILLSKEVTQDLLSKGGVIGGLAGLLGGKSVDRLKLPFTITGTPASPKPMVDFSALGQNAQDNLLDQAGKQLKDLFKKK